MSEIKFNTKEEYDKYAEAMFYRKSQMFYDVLYINFPEKKEFMEQAKILAPYLEQKDISRAYLIRSMKNKDEESNEDNTND